VRGRRILVPLIVGALASTSVLEYFAWRSNPAAIVGYVTACVGLIALVTISTIRRTEADRTAWLCVAAYLASGTGGKVVAMTNDSADSRWVAAAMWLSTTVFGIAGAVRFVCRLEFMGRSGTRSRLAALAIFGAVLVVAQYPIVSWARTGVTPSDPIGRAMTLAVAVAAIGLCIHGYQSSRLCVANSLLIVGIACSSLSVAMKGSFIDQEWIPHLVTTYCAAIFAAALHPSMVFAGATGSHPTLRANARTVTSAVLFTAVVLWWWADGPAAAVVLGVAIAVLVLGLIVALNRVDRVGRTAPSDPSRRSARSQALHADLRVAIDRDELELWFQPIVRLSDRQVAGAEALLRWNHRDFGYVNPIEILRVAEHCDLSGELNDWVFARALTLGTELLAHIDVDEPYVSVNVDPDLLTGGFADNVAKIVAQTGAIPDGFVLEITEGQDLGSNGHAPLQVAALQEMGFLVAIDDFGSGYANLGHLDAVDVDIVKIDRDLLIASRTSARGELILATAVDISRSVGALVVVEGIEDPTICDELIRMGAHYGQGWAFGHPMPAKDLCHLLASAAQSASGLRD
jgi:EAL domain-containing protein (putative c-di-GMP-specific phosphodiesterase class I)